jgi:hypothetical protein
MNLHTSIIDLYDMKMWDFMDLVRDYNAVIEEQKEAMKGGR